MNKNLIALAVAAAASTGATAAEIAKNDNASLEMGGRVEAKASALGGLRVLLTLPYTSPQQRKAA